MFFLDKGAFIVELAPRSDKEQNKLVKSEVFNCDTLERGRKYTLRISSNHLPGKYVPSGEIYILLRNTNQLHVDEPVKVCEKHSLMTTNPCVMTSSKPDVQMFTFNKKEYGIKWTVPETNNYFYETEIMFHCNTGDSNFSTKFSTWKMEIFYTEKFLGHVVLAEHPAIKVIRQIRKPKC